MDGRRGGAAPECMEWLYRNVERDLWVASGSGGTDVCTGFVAGASLLPVHARESQARSLGVSVHAFNERGEPVVAACRAGRQSGCGGQSSGARLLQRVR